MLDQVAIAVVGTRTGDLVRSANRWLEKRITMRRFRLNGDANVMPRPAI